MKLTDLMNGQAVVSSLAAENKKHLLQELARLASPLTGQSEHGIFDVLLERERLGTTGVGHGIAIPHGKVDGLKQVYGLFARLARPVDYEAIDEQPVDLVFLLLSPPDAGADHLKALASVSKILRDQELCKKIRAANDTAVLHKLLVTAEAA